MRDGFDVTDASINFKGGDVEGIEVVLTQQTTDLAGTVADGLGAPIKDYVVMVFAEEAAHWAPPTRFIRTARPDQDGRFSIRGLPPARYVAVALEYADPTNDRTTERLELLKTIGTSFSLEAGESKSLDLTLSSY